MAKYVKKDLRVIKTKKYLLKAFQSLLYKKSFDKITVNDICEKALVSRAAFYTHYNDKYALLKDSLMDTGQEFIDTIQLCITDEEQIEATIGQYIYDYRQHITHLMAESNSELLNIISDFFIHFIGCVVTGEKLKNVEETEKSIKDAKNNKDDLVYTTLYTFCAGGIVGVLVSYATKKFPPDSKEVAGYVYRIVKLLVYNGDIMNIIGRK